MLGQAKIQMMDVTGKWQTVSSTLNSDQLVLLQLQSIQRTFKRNVRAIDDRGNLIQFYPYAGEK